MRTSKSSQHVLGDATCWMSRLDDSILMSDLTIPGSHDSAAYTIDLPYIATQRVDIRAQLDSGIRYFDLRCGLRRNVLEMVHSQVRLRLELESVLQTMQDWLIRHPTEALIVQIKKDRQTQASSSTFSQAVVDLLNHFGQLVRLEDATPCLGALRGRIQLFRRFTGDDLVVYGMDVHAWQDNPLQPFTIQPAHGSSMTVQDHYRFDSPLPLPYLIEDKLGAVVKLLSDARKDHDGTHWYVNFTSAVEFNWSYRYSPLEIAEGGYYAIGHIEGVNDRLLQALEQGSYLRPGALGIVVMDFPNDNLIAALIESNSTTEVSISAYPDVWYTRRPTAALGLILCVLAVLAVTSTFRV